MGLEGESLTIEGILPADTAGPDARDRYKRPVPDPKYPQYFTRQPPSVPPVFWGYRATRGINPNQFCKVMEVKADAETVEQDVLLEPAE